MNVLICGLPGTGKSMLSLGYKTKLESMGNKVKIFDDTKSFWHKKDPNRILEETRGYDICIFELTTRAESLSTKNLILRKEVSKAVENFNITSVFSVDHEHIKSFF